MVLGIVNLDDERAWGGFAADVTIGEMNSQWQLNTFAHCLTTLCRHTAARGHTLPVDLSGWHNIDIMLACAIDEADVRGNFTVGLGDLLYFCSKDSKRRFDVSALYDKVTKQFRGLWGYSRVLWPLFSVLLASGSLRLSL